MVGLHYLKHTFNESDESVVARWVENPCWQYFCGEEYFRHAVPIDPSQMARFRDRVGDEGCEFMLSLTVRTGLDTKTVSSASLSVVNVDTTVQGKAIAFPTDARLYHKARGALVRMAQGMGIALRQSYARLSKAALARHGRYAHARQRQRAKREQKRFKTYLGRVIRDIASSASLQPPKQNRTAPGSSGYLSLAFAFIHSNVTTKARSTVFMLLKLNVLPRVKRINPTSLASR
jgi:IS5 family transposase